MKIRMAIAALAAAPALSACTTDELALFETALGLYSDVSYLNGDCPFGLNKYYDREGHHHCSFDDDKYHQDGNGHHHEEFDE